MAVTCLYAERAMATTAADMPRAKIIRALSARRWITGGA
jgi:hypothetical protein